jgi:hypothetical protein
MHNNEGHRNYLYHFDVNLQQTLVEFLIFVYKSQTFIPLQAQPFYFKRKKKMQGD